MIHLARLALGCMTLLLTLFCVFGFLASFEFPGVTRWKIGYALAFLALGMVTLQLFAKGIRGLTSSNSTS